MLEKVKGYGKLALGMGLALLPAAFAQATDIDFDAGAIATKVATYIGVIVAAGVGLLGLSIGVAAAWRFARRYLRG